MTKDKAIEEALALAHVERQKNSDSIWQEVIERLEEVREDLFRLEGLDK